MSDQSLRHVTEQLVQILLELESVSVMTREQQLWLLRQAFLKSPWLRAVLEDPDWQRSIREAATPVPDERHEGVTSELANSIQPGSVLNVSYYKLPHKVVVETCSYSEAENKLAVTAIHYGRLNLFKPVTVMRENFQLLCNGSSAWLHTFPNSVLYSSEESLSRATSRLGERQQNPMGNNAHTLAVWCRVRDSSRNLESVRVPVCDDSGAELHRLMPADHIELLVFNRKIHAVITEVRYPDAGTKWTILGVVAAKPDLSDLHGFTRATLSLASDALVERLHLTFRQEEVRKGVSRYTGACLSWPCSPLKAMAFLATGVCAEPECRRTGVPVSQLISGHVISHGDRVQVVLSVQRPASPNTEFKVEVLEYAPLQLDSAQRTSEVKFVVDANELNRAQLIRHSEPDLKCPVLMQWRLDDIPTAAEYQVTGVADLQPGDAICMRENRNAHPLESKLPGLHAIVKSVNTQEEDENSLDVICFSGTDTLTVELIRAPEKGYVFSTLQFQTSPDLLTSRDQVLQRAVARVGTAGYSCAWNNSRDFVRWCCVNHKSNAPRHLGPVTGISRLLALPALGQGQLRFRQGFGGNATSRFAQARLVAISLRDECVDLVKMSLVDIDWRPSIVQEVTLANLNRVNRLTQDNAQVINDSTAQMLSETIKLLLGTSLANASDHKLGSGVSGQGFCTWLRSLRQAGLADLACLLASRSSSAPQASPEPKELVTDFELLHPWDHIVVEQGQDTPVHLLLIETSSQTNSIRGLTYAPVVGQDFSRQLDMYMYFPPDRSPYPIEKLIQRVPLDGDASSVLSSSHAAVSGSPDDAAAWSLLCVKELELNLSRLPSELNSVLKPMLNFAFRVAARDVDTEHRDACVRGLASPSLNRLVAAAAASLPEDSNRRVLFLVKLIACLVRIGIE